MTIIIKQDQVNMLIYKYLLESGLKHTAFSLFHEANLDKVDMNVQKVAPKMLIGFLEKALLFNQIETHIYKDEHIECKETFELLVQHQCKTTDMKKQDLASKINQFNHNMESVLNEDDFNTSIIHKIKVTNEDISQFAISNKLETIALYGENDDYVSLWKIKSDNESNKTTLRPTGVIDFTCIEHKKDDFASLQWNDVEEYLMLAFRSGALLFFDSNGELKDLLKVDPKFHKDGVKWNPYSSELISIVYEESYIIINPNQGKVKKNENQRIKSLIWQNARNYAILTSEDMIYLHEIDYDMSLQVYAGDEETEMIKISPNGLFLSSFSRKTNCIKVWTMNSKDYLYSFVDNSPIFDFSWNSNEDGSAGFFNFIVIVFHHTIKIFDIEYGEIKCTIELDNRVRIVSAILYNKDTYLMITQEDGTISVYSLFSTASSNKKIHQIPSSGEIQKMVKWGTSNALGCSKNDLAIVKLKKILP